MIDRQIRMPLYIYNDYDGIQWLRSYIFLIPGETLIILDATMYI